MTDEAPKPAVDLYGVLGVERDADDKAIAAAYREKARVFHPDVPETGGTVRFQQLQLAKKILLNPRSRENYDAVGAIEEDQADNEQAFLLTALSGLFGQVMHGVVTQRVDCTKGDFVGAMLSAIKNSFDAANTQIAQLRNSKAELLKLEGRFSVKSFENPNHMESIVKNQAEQLDKQIEGHLASIRQLEMARLYLNDVNFQQDPR